MTLFGTVVTLASLAVLLWAERNGDRRLQVVSKPVASLGFLIAAWGAGLAGHAVGAAIGVGLVLSAVGDLCLLSKEKALFLAGLGAFLGAHLAYCVAFAWLGAAPWLASIAAVCLAAPAIAVWRAIGPTVPEAMRGPVLTYMGVITIMVSLALAATYAGGPRLALLAAVAFYVSDLAVAFDRFVEEHWRHRMWGLPLYYGAQLLFVWSFVG